MLSIDPGDLLAFLSAHGDGRDSAGGGSTSDEAVPGTSSADESQHSEVTAGSAALGRHALSGDCQVPVVSADTPTASVERDLAGGQGPVEPAITDGLPMVQSCFQFRYHCVLFGLF